MKNVLIMLLAAFALNVNAAGEHRPVTEEADKGFIWGCKYYRPACKEE